MMNPAADSADFCQPPQHHDDSEKWRHYAGRDIIPAWIADMDFAAASPILAAVQSRAQHGVFGYAAPPPQLSSTIGEYFERRWQWHISPDWIVFLPGLGAAIHTICRLADGGDILTPSPIYHAFRRAPTIAAAARIDVQMQLQNGEWQLPISALRTACTPQTRIFQLCNPHNPNGKIYSRDELQTIGEFCLRHNLILCADEVHADLILDNDKKHTCVAALSPEIAKITITLQSPSKAFNIAGLNFAIAVIPDDTLRRRFVAATAGKIISHLNPFGMAAAQAAWSGQCNDWLNALITRLRANRDRLAAATATMPGIHMPHLAATYLAWLNVQESGLSADDFERFGIGMSAGNNFGDNHYMRLNFACAPASLDEIIRRLQRATAKQ